MAASASANSSSLRFKHLCGGFRITLSNGSESDINIASLKVVAQSTTTVSHHSDNGFSARWAVQGPSVPTGGVGIEGDVDMKYASEMDFDLRSGENSYATVPAKVESTNGTLSFCVPVTITSVQYLTFVGYSTSGTEVFRATKDLGVETAITRNYMYTIPTININ